MNTDNQKRDNKKEGNEKLIEDMLTANYAKYYRIARSYVHNETDALDIVQEGAYKAIFHGKKLKRPDYADTWICRIMINEAITFIRKNQNYHEDLDTCKIGREETYENVDLKTALQQLPVRERTVVQLRYFEDMSLEQIAQILEENINTVKSRLYRTLAKLKLSLDEG